MTTPGDVDVTHMRMRMTLAFVLLSSATGAALAQQSPAKTFDGLAYELIGSGPAVVLVHGGLVDQRLWDGQMPVLTEHFTVLRYDLRGFGRSPLPDGPIDHVADLERLLDELGLEDIRLVGLSLGGMVAMDFTLEHPEEVERLLLVGPGLRGYATDPDPLVIEAYRSARRDPENAAALLMDQVGWISPDADPEALAKMRMMLNDNVQTWAFPRPGGMVWPEPATRERLADFEPPVFLIVGERDMAAIREIAGVLTAEIPGLQVAEIPGGSHHPNLDNPSAFNEALLRFLRTDPMR